MQNESSSKKLSKTEEKKANNLKEWLQQEEPIINSFDTNTCNLSQIDNFKAIYAKYSHLIDNLQVQGSLV